MKIDIKNISKKIGSQNVLKEISVHLESGVIYGLKGEMDRVKRCL